MKSLYETFFDGDMNSIYSKLEKSERYYDAQSELQHSLRPIDGGSDEKFDKDFMEKVDYLFEQYAIMTEETAFAAFRAGIRYILNIVMEALTP